MTVQHFAYIQTGGEELRELDPKWFRTQLSMVGQEPTLFACSIKDNISYGKESTEDEVSAYQINYFKLY